MAKKVVGGVMIIQKNADARTHPRPPAWTRKDLDRFAWTCICPGRNALVGRTRLRYCIGFAFSVLPFPRSGGPNGFRFYGCVTVLCQLRIR